MKKQLGHVSALARYPVKSMAGVAIDAAVVGWHGFEGDRRFAFRRLGDASGYPWLSASSLPEMLLYHPIGVDEPTHVRTPDGSQLELRSVELENEIAARLGSGVELMKMKHGVFDDAAISVITRATMAKISDDAGAPLDARRFRANIVLETHEAEPFEEDAWIGARLVFGETAVVSLTARDVRCMMINLDPDTAVQDARMMKTVVRLNDNNAGAYGTVVQVGTIRVGDPVSLVTS
jgi:MOSC domain-containing protein